ncbi:MAG TPA: amidoligase family protein [Polyangiales bacterium]|nr:amidoligase family protein [Polyangiales bacterium]
MEPKTRTRLQVGLAALLAVAMPAVWMVIGASVVPHFESALHALGAWREISYVVIGALAVAACAPASLLYITGGMVFGVLEGTLLGSLAGALGSGLAFAIARSTLGRRAAEFLSKRARLDRFERALTERPLRISLLLRLSLLFPIGPVSYALGLTRIPAKMFLVTSPGLIPAVLTYAYAGHVARGVAEGRPREPWEWVLLGIGLLATGGTAWLVGRAATRALGRQAPPSAAGKKYRPSRPTDVPIVTLPPVSVDAAGNPRTVGVEIEFSGLPLEAASRTLIELYGGTAVPENEYELRVTGTRLGDFHVEVDSHLLKTLGKKKRRGKVLDWVERMQAVIFGSVAGSLTPHEISTSPIPMARVGELDRLVHALGRAGAEGTDDWVWNVLGVHFNPSVPSDDPAVLLDYLRAYSLMHPELVDALRVDATRRFMRFATAYPDAYVRKILDPAYQPDLHQLIGDYLEHNPTRNRALDCLPLFAHYDLERVRAACQDPRVWGRPTFHFRLPNSEVSDQTWRISDEWKLWIEVERLAADRERIATLSEVALAQLENPIPLFRSKWNALGGWIAEHR